jgi:predicted nucleic acid-binding protein
MNQDGSCSVLDNSPTNRRILRNAKSGRLYMPSIAAWVDTGFLVALFARNDPHHTSAVEFLANHQRLSLHSLWPVVTEAGFFLDTSGKMALLSWLECHGMILHDLGVADLPEIRATLFKYQNLAPDFTDAALVTLAGIHGINRIITVDIRDFSAYRLPNGRAFERLWL